MLVTRETDYAVRCVLYLSAERDRVASVAEVSKAMRIPKSFLAKIVQRLVGAGILESIRGVKGGFHLARKPAEINLLSIMEAIQGAAGINICAVNSKLCGMSSSCSVHPVWVDIRKDVEKRLKGVSMAQLMKS